VFKVIQQYLIGGVVVAVIMILIYFAFLTSNSGIVATSLVEAASVGTGAGTRSIIVNKDGLICAEPSPDIMMSFLTNAEAAAEGEQEGTKAEGLLKILQQVGGEQIFERSQGIQALRDGMYRLCEAHLNKAIPQDTYVEQMTDLVATLNFIVPIELCSKLNTDLSRLQLLSQDAILEQPTEGEENTVPMAGETTNDLAARPDGDLSDMDAYTTILSLCIDRSFQFGVQIAGGSVTRGTNRLQSQQAMRFSRFRIAYALRERGFSCLEIADMTEGEIDCLSLGIRPEAGGQQEAGSVAAKKAETVIGPAPPQ
jgi:hypothetical protein